MLKQVANDHKAEPPKEQKGPIHLGTTSKHRRRVQEPLASTSKGLCDSLQNDACRGRQGYRRRIGHRIKAEWWSITGRIHSTGKIPGRSILAPRIAEDVINVPVGVTDNVHSKSLTVISSRLVQKTCPPIITQRPGHTAC